MLAFFAATYMDVRLWWTFKKIFAKDSQQCTCPLQARRNRWVGGGDLPPPHILAYTLTHGLQTHDD